MFITCGRYTINLDHVVSVETHKYQGADLFTVTLVNGAPLRLTGDETAELHKAMLANDGRPMVIVQMEPGSVLQKLKKALQGGAA